MQSKLTLPDYREQSPAVRERFERIAQRPVIMRIDKLGKRFEGAHGEIAALVDIDFEIRRREFICVIGPSGCGKSTLIRIVAGLETPERIETPRSPAAANAIGQVVDVRRRQGPARSGHRRRTRQVDRPCLM